MPHDPFLSHTMIRCNGMKLSLEVIVASLADQSTVRYFILNEDITGWEYDPDKIVLELLDSPECDFPSIAKDNCFVHSTQLAFRATPDHRPDIFCLLRSADV
jgi:hypothetical protein